MEESLRLYRDLLSFDVEAMMGEPPSFALIKKDGASMSLLQHTPVYDVGDAGVNIYIDVTGVDELYSVCKKAGIEMSYELTTHPWGMKDFVIVDPDGHQIAFGERQE